MGEKKEEDLYRNFSRKDLQGLCKKYGLPANKSNSEMATSVILYLEKKNISSKDVWEVPESDPYLSLWSELQPGVRMNSSGNKKADFREMSSQNGFGQSRKHQVPDQNGLQNFKGPAYSDKASEDMGPLTQPHGGSNSGAGDAENAFSSVLSSTTKASTPSFTYAVSCPEGIQLVVDLNSTTSDWIESMKAEVHVCHDIHDHKSRSSDEKKGSSLMDSHNTPQPEDESCPTTKKAGVALQADEVGGESPSLPGLESLKNTVHNLEGLGEERGNLSSIPKLAELRNRGSEYLIRKENKPGTNSDPSLVTQIRTLNFSGNTTPYDPKYSKIGDGMYKEPCLKQTCGPPDPVFKNSRLSRPPFLGVKASSGVNSVQSHNIATSSSIVATRLVSADQAQNNRAVQFGPFCPTRFRGNVPQMWHQVEFEHGRASISNKSSQQASEAQTHFVQSSEKIRPYFPFQGLSWTNVNPDTSIDTGNCGFISSHESGQAAVKLPRKDTSSIPMNIGGPLDLAVPKKNRSDNHIVNYSMNLGVDDCRSQVRINLGDCKASDGSKSSEFNNMKEPGVKPANSEYNQAKMKRPFSSVDERRQPDIPEANISPASRQFSGDARASRRRSKRPVTKSIVHDKNGDARDKP